MNILELIGIVFLLSFVGQFLLPVAGFILLFIAVACLACLVAAAISCGWEFIKILCDEIFGKDEKVIKKINWDEL